MVTKNVEYVEAQAQQKERSVIETEVPTSTDKTTTQNQSPLIETNATITAKSPRGRRKGTRSRSAEWKMKTQNESPSTDETNPTMNAKSPRGNRKGPRSLSTEWKMKTPNESESTDSNRITDAKCQKAQLDNGIDERQGNFITELSTNQGTNDKDIMNNKDVSEGSFHPAPTSAGNDFGNSTTSERSLAFPGAIAVGGSDDDVVIEEDRSGRENDAKNYYSDHDSSNLVVAEAVDEDAIIARYKVQAKERILSKIQAESAQATEVSCKRGPNENGKKASNVTYCIGIVSALAVITTLALGLGFGLSRPGKKSETMKIPTSPPSMQQSSIDFAFLQDQFWSISGDMVFNSSSAQYMALEWLVYEDPFVMDLKHVEVSSLSVRYALSVLYFSTSGPNWTNNTQFLTNTSVCGWQSIDCNVLGSVVEINMANNNMNGKIPSELAVLSELERIDFYGNYLTSTIPDAVGNLSRLKIFDVGENYLTGPIPNSFSQLINLEVLILDLNMLTGTIPQDLADIRRLENLGSSGNLLTGTIPSFTQRDLEAIWLSDNLLEGSIPDSMLTLNNLEILDLFNNWLSGTIPSEINGMRKLHALYLDGNILSGTIPSSMGELEYLEHIWLFDNRINGTIPSELGQLTKLIFMVFDNNRLTGEIPSEIGLLRDLLRFGISGNSITGTVPPSFSDLTSLDSFYVSNTSISGDLDVLFCYPYSNNTLVFLEADCGGPFPEVNCTCCTKCCDDDSDVCEMSSSQLCENHIVDLESLSEMTVCSCTDNNSSVSCTYMDDCQTCNEDETICGTSIEYGWKSNFSTFINTFTYEKGGRNDTIVWEEYSDEEGMNCNVTVNGNECDMCLNSICDDGYVGFYIDCTNIINDDSSGFYDSCGPYKEGGIFDVFTWMDFESWTGCPFITTSYWIG